MQHHDDAPAGELALADADQPDQPGAMLHLTATLVAFGATTLVRRALDGGYRRATGRPTPAADASTSLGRALAWAALTAATAAVVEVAVLRIVEGRRRY